MKKPLADLYAQALHRPPGYAEDVLSKTTARDETHYEISEAAWDELRRRYAHIGVTSCPRCQRPWNRTRCTHCNFCQSCG